jgi:hypothetical protein
MKAWVVKDSYEECATVVFDNHGLAARRRGANKLNTDFEDVLCERAERFDEFSNIGYVPAKELVESGWHFECENCSRQITSDTETATFTEQSAYCSAGCREQRKAKIDRINHEYEEFQVSILNAWCRWDVVKFTGGWPYLTPTAYFTFPGAKWLGKISTRGSKRELECYVCNGDMEAYELAEEARK